jgi:hypothetical protein
MTEKFKHVYHFHRNLKEGPGGTGAIMDWCYEQGGERKVNWDVWSKFHSGGAGYPVSVDVGLTIEDDETALAFELAFNVKESRIGDDYLLKYVTKSV